MDAPIMSRDKIARLADDAAADWVTNPSRAKPLNPFDAYEQPEHYAAWRASFERALLVRSTREVSA